MVTSYIKILISCANFTNAFRETYKNPRVAASIPESALMFK